MDDPYSKYLTREELRQELSEHNDGFLGLGAIVEVPKRSPAAPFCDETALYSVDIECLPKELQTTQKQREGSDYSLMRVMSRGSIDSGSRSSSKLSASLGEGQSGSPLLSLTRASNLPVVTAVTPHSPAERAGIVVGDRIVAVGSDKFVGRSREEIARALASRYAAENYAGFPDLTIAKPILVSAIPTTSPSMTDNDSALHEEEHTTDVAATETKMTGSPTRVIGFRSSRVR
ncbi:MAG: PDZ domain-containing protein, partial [Gaiellaceae bacterium]